MGSTIDDIEAHCQVLIVGGGIAGLALANCLELAGISYILWESHFSITPQMGASIGLLPHGLRILDQLGLMEEIERITVPGKSIMHRDASGRIVATDLGVASYIDVFGYSGLFFERRKLLELMFNNLTDKTPVYTSKKVVCIEQDATRAVVTAADGTRVSADLVVGADGVRSVVRQSINDSIAPLSTRTDDPNYLSSRFACIYGISAPHPKLPEGEGHSLYRADRTFLVFTGKGGVIYWFGFVDMGRSYSFKEKPRFSDEDCERACCLMADYNVTEEVSFGEIYERKSIATMVALEEGVAHKWFSGRAVILGDAAHKMVPNAAMGGNLAIESAACLSNLLVVACKASKDYSLSQPAIASALEAFAIANRERAAKTVEFAGAVCRRQLLSSPENIFELKAMGKFTAEQWLQKAMVVLSAATKIEYLTEMTPREKKYGDAVRRFRLGQEKGC